MLHLVQNLMQIQQDYWFLKGINSIWQNFRNSLMEVMNRPFLEANFYHITWWKSLFCYFYSAIVTTSYGKWECGIGI